SPATSLVLVATDLASWAPRFSYGSTRSTSRAIVTPSLVMTGGPKDLSSTTFRPRGPRVTLTALANWLTPRSRARRAFSAKLGVFRTEFLSRTSCGGRYVTESAPDRTSIRASGACLGNSARLLLDDREHVA